MALLMKHFTFNEISATAINGGEAKKKGDEDDFQIF